MNCFCTMQEHQLHFDDWCFERRRNPDRMTYNSLDVEDMMSLRNADWWFDFVTRLHEESLSVLAKEFGVKTPALLEALLEGTPREVVQAEFWWPEADRMHQSGVPIVEIGGMFRRSPADLRLALENRAVVKRKKKRKQLSELVPVRRRVARESSRSAPSRKRRRLVRPDSDVFVTATPLPAEPAARKVRRKKVDSLHGKVIEIDPTKVDVTEMLDAISTPQSPSVQPSVPPTVGPEITVLPSAPVLVEDEPAIAQKDFATAADTQRVDIEHCSPAETLPGPAVVEPPSMVGTPMTTGWRIRVNGQEQPMVVLASNPADAAHRFAEVLGDTAMQCAELYSTAVL